MKYHRPPKLLRLYLILQRIYWKKKFRRKKKFQHGFTVWSRRQKRTSMKKNNNNNNFLENFQKFSSTPKNFACVITSIISKRKKKNLSSLVSSQVWIWKEAKLSLNNFFFIKKNYYFLVFEWINMVPLFWENGSFVDGELRSLEKIQKKTLKRKKIIFLCWKLKKNTPKKNIYSSHILKIQEKLYNTYIGLKNSTTFFMKHDQNFFLVLCYTAELRNRVWINDFKQTAGKKCKQT